MLQSLGPRLAISIMARNFDRRIFGGFALGRGSRLIGGVRYYFDRQPVLFSFSRESELKCSKENFKRKHKTTKKGDVRESTLHHEVSSCNGFRMVSQKDSLISCFRFCQW